MEFKPPVIRPLLVPSKDLFSKRFKDDKSTGTESSKAHLILSPNFSPPSKKMRIGHSNFLNQEQPDTIMPLVYYSYEVDSKSSQFARHLGDLLRPQTMESYSAKSISQTFDETTGQAFHVFQSAMALRDLYESEFEKFSQLETEHKTCPEKLQAALDRAGENLKMAKEIQKELDDFVVKVQYLESEMREVTNKAAKQQIMRTRVEMMLEYSCGEWESWDVCDTLKTYNELFPNDAFALDDFNIVEGELKTPLEMTYAPPVPNED
ncbi:uncharacterized protein LOC141708563 isoform X2 [Apium graveolens]|uniref:uncharacterized protein LOC141708563 isoform X2 n=1 Tax=Apium graveolens TaxID=4045 RepID=UPI003D7B6A5E